MSLAMQTYGERTFTSLQSIVDDPANFLMSSGTSLQRPIGGDLDILSASQYPQGLMQPYAGVERNPRKRKTTSSDQLYGGIVVEEVNRLSSAERETRSSQKKTKQTKQAPIHDADDQADSKKQRGRPRVDTQDETAADRRRTQIRLAQRAYRHRKETTISALNQKVSGLQKTIEQMNKIFLTLHDNMIGAGIMASHYSLGRQLQAAAEQFAALSKVAESDSDEEEEKIAHLTKGESQQNSKSGSNNRRASGRSVRESASQSPKRADVASATGFDQRSSDARADAEEASSTNTNHINSDQSEVANYNDQTLLDLSQPLATEYLDQQGFGDLGGFETIPESFLVDSVFDRFPVERPLTSSYHQGLYTYSFQETTFARRLHRMCLERGFRTLSNPETDPAYVRHTFRFTFCFSNRKSMLQRFQERLKRRAGESLENFNAPFFHIGGAGTHFPRHGQNGDPIYPPNLVHPAKAFGPQPYIQVETPHTEKSTQELLEKIGFGGEWYDSHDVEEYLKTKGIYLDGQSSFVDVDASVLQLVKGGGTSQDATKTLSLSSENSSPHDASLHTPSPLLADVADPFIDPAAAYGLTDTYAQPGGLFSGTLDPATSGANMRDPSKSATPLTNSWDDFTSQISPTSFQDMSLDIPQSQFRSLVTFDVEQFLEHMVVGSACLGRAPGFRKETVDNALLLSLQQSF